MMIMMHCAGMGMLESALVVSSAALFAQQVSVQYVTLLRHAHTCYSKMGRVCYNLLNQSPIMPLLYFATSLFQIP